MKVRELKERLKDYDDEFCMITDPGSLAVRRKDGEWVTIMDFGEDEEEGGKSNE